MSNRRHMPALLLAATALSAAALCGAGCARTRMSQFYLMDARTREPGAVAPEAGTLYIYPPKLPEYLRRNEIVVRAPDGRVRPADFHRWAEPLGQGVARVLAAELSRLLPSRWVVAHPVRKAPGPVTNLALTVTRFDGRRGGSVVLSAQWNLSSEKDGEYVLRHSRIEVPVQGGDYAALVEAHQQALYGLAAEIAEAVDQISGIGSAAAQSSE
ncbi:MAG: PqiC family protein [Planctomycetota bacterium]